MTWFKTDDKLWGNTKWRCATKEARALWITAGSWCADQENDGHIPRHMLPLLDGTPKEAQNLVDVGLWDVTNNGWVFHDFLDYNPSKSALNDARKREREKKKRWRERTSNDAAGRFTSTGDARGDDTVDSRGKSTRNPSRPDPSSLLTSRGHVASLLGWHEEDERLHHLDTLLADHDVRNPRAWLDRCHETGDLERLLTDQRRHNADPWANLPMQEDPPPAPDGDAA